MKNHRIIRSFFQKLSKGVGAEASLMAVIPAGDRKQKVTKPMSGKRAERVRRKLKDLGVKF